MNFVCFGSSCVSFENVRLVELIGHTIKFHYSTRTPIYYTKKIAHGGEFEFVTVGFDSEEEAKKNFEKVKKLLDKSKNL